MRTPQLWQHKNFLSGLLLPAAAIYGVGAALDRHFTKVVRAPLPVISVGNVTAGGAGKTPTTFALIPLLRSIGFVPHVISRGYGGAALHAHRVAATDDWRMVGDEPLLLAKAAPAWVGARRIDSARAAKQAGASIVIADDGLQHYALHKDVSLLVIDGSSGIGNGRLLPAGPLRESLESGLKSCDAVVMIGEDRHQVCAPISKPVFRANFVPVGDVGWLNDASVIAFAGIAYPQKFYDSLREHGAKILSVRDFPDHHPYARSDIENLLAETAQQSATLVTTAKDAVKIPEDLRAKLRVFDVELRWQDEAAITDWLRAQCANVAAAT